MSARERQIEAALRRLLKAQEEEFAARQAMRQSTDLNVQAQWIVTVHEMAAAQVEAGQLLDKR